jgi:hypothetical protein
MMDDHRPFSELDDDNQPRRVRQSVGDMPQREQLVLSDTLRTFHDA